MKILIFIAYVLLRMFERLFLIVSSLSGMAAYIIAGAAMVVGAIILIMWFTADEEHVNLLPAAHDKTPSRMQPPPRFSRGCGGDPLSRHSQTCRSS